MLSLEEFILLDQVHLCDLYNKLLLVKDQKGVNRCNTTAPGEILPKLVRQKQ